MLIPLRISALTILLLTKTNFIKSSLVPVRPVSELLKPQSERVLLRESLKNEVNSENVDPEVFENLLPQAEESLLGTDGTELPPERIPRPPPLDESGYRRQVRPNTRTQVEERRMAWDTPETKREWQNEGNCWKLETD
ncbi:hypothetical protein CROQUDRAFT_102604 [Cronartium quercuum f. sp. fusiforme G11]|uniref:Uncharacterized protein n=1 Tax=Cronartium quercuum f. sp. fusiforme G11 TaxID=708437 RepID=A0A9P6N7S5_9BASI|nr:hypothetical protein CROQUDRAFT_102604 [Cronartium quercuum f. sp. fusiforme G11]